MGPLHTPAHKAISPRVGHAEGFNVYETTAPSYFITNWCQGTLDSTKLAYLEREHRKVIAELTELRHRMAGLEK